MQKKSPLPSVSASGICFLLKPEAHRGCRACAAETPLVLCLDSGHAFVHLILLATGGFPFLRESQLVEDT